MNRKHSKENVVNLPPRMKKSLEQYQKRVWIIKLAEGTLAALFGLIISYLFVFGLDRIYDTPALLRALILVVGMVGMAVFLPLKYYKWVWRNRQLEGIARLLKHKFPRFGDHVLGVIELASKNTDETSSPALVAAAMHQVDEEVAKHNLSGAVPNPRHRRWTLAVGLPLVVVLVGVIVIPATTGNSLVRWLTPWRNIDRYTFAQLDGKSERRVVAYAEPFDIEANLKDESPWKPEAGEARIADQNPVVAERQEATYKFQLPPQIEDGEVNLRIGDARRSIPVEPKLRPALKELIATVQLPDYLQRAAPRVDDVRGGIVNLVKGSVATLEATTTRELSAATLDNRLQKVDGARIITEPISVDTTTKMQLTWTDSFGLSASEPQGIQIEAKEDAAPTVALTKLKNNRVVLSTETLTFEIQTNDDFGVKHVGLEWVGVKNPIHNPDPVIGEKTVAAGTPTSEELTVPATFSVERENIKPQSLRLRAYVEDYFPNRERVYSPQIMLHIFSPADHYKWLIGQMQLWAGAAKDVHDRELQLHQINRELSELSPEALDDPAQRKQLQIQAAAERSNAAKLDSLIESGTELLQEATKNEEFDGDQLESWAEMLQELGDIASKKMPSVADLLAQASEAQGQPSQPQTPGEPTESSPQKNGQGQPSDSPSNGSEDDTEKYGPDFKVPTENADQDNPDDPNKSGDMVTVDRSKTPAGGKPSFAPANPFPGISDVESGFNPFEDPSDCPT